MTPSKDNFTGQSILDYQIFSFIILIYCAVPFWPPKILMKNLLIILLGFPCTFFSVHDFYDCLLKKYISTYIHINTNIYIHTHIQKYIKYFLLFFKFILLGTLWLPQTWLPVCFHRLGKYLAFISTDKFSALSFYSPFRIPTM